MVFVQCEAEFSQFQEEADWVTGLAEGEEPRIAGIVPWAPLELGDEARPTLEKLARNGLVKGIRRIIQFEPNPEFCLRPGFVRGVQALSDYGLHFEICIVHTQMANTIKLVEQCPNVTFILDHIGKPGIKDHIMDPWRQDLKTLAGFPNLWCKISGLVTEADHEQWTREDLRPYLDHIFDTFGFERVMYGGDWPVAWQATEYPRWVETLAWAITGCSAEESRMLFHDNALDFYRLREPGKGGARD